jgi:glycosyltransferase involved in cell wall biosynthesis
MAHIVSHGITGAINIGPDGAVSGWAVDSAGARLTLLLLVDGKEVAAAICDLASRATEDGQAGFRIEMPAVYCDGVPHIVQLRARDGRLIVFRNVEAANGAPVIRLEKWRKNGKTPAGEAPAGQAPAGEAPAGEAEGNPACGFIFLHDKVNRLGTAAPLNFFISPGGSDKPRTALGADTMTGPADEAAQLAALRASGLFDEAYYLSTYPDVAGADIPLLEHFFKVGYREGRQPNPYFDPDWYLRRNPDVAVAGMQPLLHFLLHGDRMGLDPGPLFDVEWFREHYGVSESENTLARYLRLRLETPLSPVREFDAAYYAAKCPDVVAARIDLFEHFWKYGFKELRNPSADFDVKFYIQRYLKGDYSKNPLEHYRANRNRPDVRGRPADDEITLAREMKRYCRPGPYFEELEPARPGPKRAMVLAYYLPQFHAFAENDAWWGKGFTEWTNLTRGAPRFAGHYQPRVPRDLGFYTLDSVETMRSQIEMALAGGVSGFVFYYYWFNGKRLMDQPLNRFLADESLRMPFALMWANENWTRRWDGQDAEVLISQDYRKQDDRALAAGFAEFFRDSRYIRLQGRPLLMIYRAELIPETRSALARWRAIFNAEFNEDPIFVMAQAFDAEDPRDYGFDGAVEFPPHKLTRKLPPSNIDFTYLDADFSGKILHYDDVAGVSLREAQPNYPLIKTAIPSWDNDARRQGAGMTIAGSTPLKYEVWLTKLIEQARGDPFFGTPLVCVNAWNEWCEGAYLEPDLYFGGAYLNATARAVAGRSRDVAAPRLVLVGHDAFPAGAQQLLLNIGRVLRRDFGVEFEFLLLGGGAMQAEYAAVGPVSVAADDAQLGEKLRKLAETGFSGAIVNTLAAGRAVAYLQAAGIEPVLLVHELPRILREKQLTSVARQALNQAGSVVFSAPFVRDAVLGELEVPQDDRMRILPQGAYKQICYDAKAAAAIRAEFGLSEDAHLVLGCGYADLRKGFDLFLQLWRHLAQGGGVCLVWAGGIDPALAGWLGDEIAAAEATGMFRMAGQRHDMAALFYAASAFALTSREDPLPAVVMEALSAGLPVTVFDKSGGIPDLLREIGEGVIVPYGDTAAMAAAIRQMIKAGIPKADRAARHAKIARQFDFPLYVNSLMKLASPGFAEISVAVPNFNYARHLPARLNTVFAQTYPVREVIVLDDASRDASVAVINQTAEQAGRRIKLVVNKRNAGCVFAQWRRAAEMAAGEFVWLAEADDEAEPDFLARIAALLMRDARMSLAFSDSRTVLGDGSAQWASYKDYYDTVEPGGLRETGVFHGKDFARRFMAVKNVLVNASAVVWRRSALLAAFDACGKELPKFRMAGDWILYLTAMAQKDARIGYEARILNIHRRHQDSVTHTLGADAHVAEIARCHAYARKLFAPPAAVAGLQAAYRGEVKAQLTRTAARRGLRAAALRRQDKVEEIRA